MLMFGELLWLLLGRRSLAIIPGVLSMDAILDLTGVDTASVSVPVRLALPLSLVLSVRRLGTSVWERSERENMRGEDCIEGNVSGGTSCVSGVE
jgi:hypothetical protein